MTAMQKIFRFLRFCLLSILALGALLALLFAYYVYTPTAKTPKLSGTLTKGTIEIPGVKRTYLTYVPKGLKKGAPLVVVMHGSGQSGAQIRVETGYGFERLADQHHFAIAYPNAYLGYWDVCSKVGAVEQNGRNIDDTKFLTALVDKHVAELGSDPGRVFAVGSSRGGSMALRLALESPSHFRAVAAVSASVPTPDNFKCKVANQTTSSVLIMNGTEDPIVPFSGGEVSLFGVAYKNGNMLSSLDSGQYFANLNHILAAPEMQKSQSADGISIEHVLWHDDSKVEVELVAIHGGGHGMPQPFQRRPRILGPSVTEPNGPAVIWAFFDRQRP